MPSQSISASRPAHIWHHLTVAACAVPLWWAFARIAQFGSVGMWSYPEWWRSYFPSYFQIGALLIPVALLPVTHVLTAEVDPATGTLLAATALFPQFPATCVVSPLNTPSLQSVLFLAGAVFVAYIPHRVRRLTPLLWALAASLLLFPLLFARVIDDRSDAIATAWHYVFHLGLPAQLSSLVISAGRRSRPTSGVA